MLCFRPKNKYIRITKDERFKPEEHALSTAPSQSEAACSYDLDECDVSWLRLLNEERACCGLHPITEDQLERILEKLELRCYDRIQSILRNEEGLGIEYDENVICDVCRSPDSEEGNEMVFCDSCNICVHQACYGITRIPDGQWLCCTCALSKRPECVLCPNKGGAMKSTRSGKNWAHVSCALWIPEVSIGCVEKMEPITKISSIPHSRWALICVLCRERVGACIQCSVKTCKTAYHVTCAFKHGLEMRAIIEDENADDGVKLRSYCEKHSKSGKKEKSVCSGSEDDDSKRRKRKDMTSEEKNQARAVRLQEIESEFHKHVSVKDITVHMDVDSEAVQHVYNYWKLKRKAGNNRPLLPPKSEDVDVLSQKQEQADLEKMKMFVQLRQDLERVRNLCYMVSRREKLSRTYFRMREQTFHKQIAVLAANGHNMTAPTIHSVIEANHGPSIYDRLYSHNGAEDHTTDFDVILSRITGTKSPIPSERQSEANGVFREVKNNPFKKIYVNGSKRHSDSMYGSEVSSVSSGDERPKENKENCMEISSEDDKNHSADKHRKGISQGNKVAVGGKTTERRRKRYMVSKETIDSSSEEDITAKTQDTVPKSRLRQIENELGMSSDSDELVILPNSRLSGAQRVKAMRSIYSDSDSSDLSTRNDDKSSNATNDSHHNKLRTKAAVKEFSQKPTLPKSPHKSGVLENKGKTKEEMGKEALVKRKGYVPSDLIVPQREAAKKASENMKSTTNTRVKEQQISQVTIINETEVKTIIDEKPKLKSRNKPLKEVKEVKENMKKDIKNDLLDADKEIEKSENAELLAIVPQRQAAKKASETIKSHCKPVTVDISNDSEKNKNGDTSKCKKFDVDVKKKEEKEDKVAKVTEIKRKSSTNSSTSSSSTSSTDSSNSTSSSSETEDDDRLKPQSESLFLPHDPRESTNKRSSSRDWPFLVKDTKSLASSSSSDSSDTSRSSSSDSATTNKKVETSSSNIAKQESPPQPLSPIKRSHTVKPFVQKVSDNKKQPPTPIEREELATKARGKGRRNRGRPRASNASDRFRDIDGRPGDIVDSKRSHVEGDGQAPRKGKLDYVGTTPSTEKESSKHLKRPSPIRKADKKLNKFEEPNLGNLEKEILERKAEREGSNNKSKSTLDRLFGSQEKSGKELQLWEKRKFQERSRKENVLKSSPMDNIPVDSLSKLSEKQPKTVDIFRPSEMCAKYDENNDKSYAAKTEILQSKVNSPERCIESSDSPIKENKEPTSLEVKGGHVRKSFLKTKSIDDIFSSRMSSLNVQCEIGDDKKSLFKEDVSEGQLLPNNSVAKIADESKNDGDDIKRFRAPQNRSIFSPQPHVKDADFLDEFDNILNDDFAISKDETLKGTVPLFKEDSKEDSARETLNLVEKLRMKLSKKSTGGYDVDDSASIESNLKNEVDRLEFSEQIVPNNNVVADQIRKDEVAVVDDRHDVDMEVEEEKNYLDGKIHGFEYLDGNMEVSPSIQLHERLHDHAGPGHQAPSDNNRWISSESYPNMQSIEQKEYTEQGNIVEVEPFVQSFQSDRIGMQIDTVMPSNDQLETTVLPVQVENDSHKSPPVQDRRITQTPFLDPTSMDCMASPSPYADMHPQAKWADSQVMPNRRSSTSSPASTSSTTSSRRNDVDDELMKRQEMLLNHQTSMELSYGVLQPLPHPPQSMVPFGSNSGIDGFTTFPDGTSPYVGPVSLFPPPSLNNQLSFSSSGPAMFPPPFGAPFPTSTSIMNPLPKPVEDGVHFDTPCLAAFTLSQQNMALTAQMVNPPMPAQPSSQKELPSQREDQHAVGLVTPLEPRPLISGEDITAPPSVLNNSATPNSTHVLPSPNPSLKSNTSSVGKKSPSKPTRTSARFLTQQSKSPGKSPRQSDAKHNPSKGRAEGRRGKSNSGRNGVQVRGRGRGRGRGKGAHLSNADLDCNTIHNKLVGTVYEFNFDDGLDDSVGDLKAMRERRKSVDVHVDRNRNDTSHGSDPAKFTSPTQQQQHIPKGRYGSNFRELRPPTPNKDNDLCRVGSLTGCDVTTSSFPDIVQPVLPGPVDMRTYNSGCDVQPYNESNLLGVFASSGGPQTRIHEEIDEDFEKELRSALTKKPDEEMTHTPEVSNIKASLSDSRNQLKVKIKGPIANYTSTIAPLPIATVDMVSNSAPTLVSNSATVANPSGMSTGTQNLRRMRKKELLRQYWTQDMNMDDSATAVGTCNLPSAPPVNRTIITIPKAITSMTSIPTKDDYRDYRTGDDAVDTKIRKEKTRSAGMSRELRQLDISIDDERRIMGVGGGLQSFGSEQGKRRGRPVRTSSQPTPKLKIRIRGNSIVTTGKIDEKRIASRPPKKRLARPSIEDLKRESMKYRKQVMADFGKKNKSNKRKKKQKPEVHIIADDSATKLIIRFGKKNGDSDSARRNNVLEGVPFPGSVSDDVGTPVADRTDRSSEYSVGSEVAGTINKSVPIKLKFLRLQQGSGYVMKANAVTVDTDMDSFLPRFKSVSCRKSSSSSASRSEQQKRTRDSPTSPTNSIVRCGSPVSFTESPVQRAGLLTTFTGSPAPPMSLASTNHESVHHLTTPLPLSKEGEVR